MATRILIADDHQLVAAGYQALLEVYEDLEVVGCVTDGRDVVAMVVDKHPDVLLLDLSLPSKSGLDLLPALREQPVAILVVTAHRHESYIRRALELGASGYVLKCDPPRDLVEAVRAARRGATYLSSSIPKEQVHRGSSGSDPYDSLSEREREVLHFTARGWTTPKIAGHLTLSVRVVEDCRRRARVKLGIRNQSELVRWMVRREALDPDCI